MKFGKNKDRVVDPDRDERLRAVAACVARSGYPPEHADILAEGFVARLRRRVYAALNDVIGTGNDLESLAGWQGPPRALSAVMNRVGYTRDINGVYVMVDAINEAPEYLKKRWQRADRAGYDAAVKRSGVPNIVNQPFGVPGDDDDYDYEGEMKKDDERDQLGLWVDDAEKGRDSHEPGFKEACANWAERFQACYGYAYVWQGRCNRHARDLLQWAGSVEQLAATFTAYLADKWKGYDGHRLADLWRDREKFRARVSVARRGNAKLSSKLQTEAGRAEL